MHRRKVIQLVTLATGATISTPLLSSLLTSCKQPSSSDLSGFEPRFFSVDDFKWVHDLVNVILPKTDSPSAVDVGVHQTIDTMLDKVYKPLEQEQYKKSFFALRNYLIQESNNEFFDLDYDNQLRLVEDLSLTTADNLSLPQQGLLNLKQQTIAYYLQTEEIATNFLNYLPVPGQYLPCIPVEETGNKAWAI